MSESGKISWWHVSNLHTNPIDFQLGIQDPFRVKTKNRVKEAGGVVANEQKYAFFQQEKKDTKNKTKTNYLSEIENCCLNWS